jgi:hypothetical protein
VSTIVAVAVWFGATVLLWLIAAATTRGAQKVAFTLLAVCGGVTSGILVSPKTTIPAPLILIYIALFVGAVALDISQARGIYPKVSRSTGIGAIIAALVMLIVCLNVGGFLLFEVPRIIRDALARNISFLSANSGWANVLAFAIVFGGVYLFVFVSAGAVIVWKRAQRCAHGVRGGAYHQKCPACADTELLYAGSAPSHPLCPRCSAPMKLRSGRYGSFWGCTRYPRCKSTRSLR